MTAQDPFNLNRFIAAQASIYQTALNELKLGQKRSHWMWYIFPQLRGLGRSTMAKYYGIKNLDEAQHYLNHPILGKRLLYCAETVLILKNRTISEILGYPDDLKFKSSMTLFSQVADSSPLFEANLTKYCQGESDQQTLQLLNRNVQES